MKFYFLSFFSVNAVQNVSLVKNPDLSYLLEADNTSGTPQSNESFSENDDDVINPPHQMMHHSLPIPSMTSQFDLIPNTLKTRGESPNRSIYFHYITQLAINIFIEVLKNCVNLVMNYILEYF